VDTVPDLTPDLSKGNGFVFSAYSSGDLIEAILRGTKAFKNKDAWNKAAQRVMNQDFSWRTSGLKYEAAYRRILDGKSVKL
jgi:glycogen synthase